MGYLYGFDLTECLIAGVRGQADGESVSVRGIQLHDIEMGTDWICNVERSRALKRGAHAAIRRHYAANDAVKRKQKLKIVSLCVCVCVCEGNEKDLTLHQQNS